MDIALKLLQVVLPIVVELVGRHHWEQHPDARRTIVNDLIVKTLEEHYAANKSV